ncbi:hypothetical protein [Corynebacterium freneyi]|uniref:Uncharacterized protein n=1 Tax=Corynebacterium freneyi TaxID=134034 RepID=A0ABS4U9U4_9CORY|nr:hypothetical protein [Corynebacterium freneyi]MBP2333276.1 hypothetical protein [Corynebacterium freneyi]QXA52671.1 hypothetical protein I6L56_11595 [Corynebacterium freneyi]WJZ04620.1 hypothetical protein CFREN_03170 [Corynebacterium freneyi]
MTTAHAIAVAIHHKHGVDTVFAAEAVETYITQIESVDGREIDRDAITEDDADFITGAFASAQRAGDFGTRELDDVANAADAVAAAKTALEDAEHTRNQAVKRALAHGARVVDVTAAAGVTRARIDQIRQGRR